MTRTVIGAALATLVAALVSPLAAQAAPELDRVLLRPADAVLAPLPMDRGAAGLYPSLLRLTTTASVLHTTAHPDDEHSGALALLGRGLGVRTALLSLNRGEAGANAIGPELFDGLGVIRTEELLLAGAHYGLDDLYFTTAIDYGFSKTLDEAMRSWERELVLEDMVRVIRLNRPLVVISRFHGSGRDGHGHHQTAGVLTAEAVAAAGDLLSYPDQITVEGLRPWAPRLVYRGGVRDGENWHVRLDPGQRSALLGATYDEIGRRGISLQRSQTGGRMRTGRRPAYIYERVGGEAGGNDLFGGLPVGLRDVFELTAEDPPPAARGYVAEADTHARAALAAFSVVDPASVLPPLVAGLTAVRSALGELDDQQEAAFLLRIKARQFSDAIATALGLELAALASGPSTAGEGGAASFLGAVPGAAFDVQIRLVNPSPTTVAVETLSVLGPGGTPVYDERFDDESVADGIALERTVTVSAPTSLPPTRRYHHRESLLRNHYLVRDSSSLHRPRGEPPFRVRADVQLEGRSVRLEAPVRIQRPDLPYGFRREILKVVPAVSVEVPVGVVVVSAGEARFSHELSVGLTGYRPDGVAGEVRIEAPAGVSVVPSTVRFEVPDAGSTALVSFTVSGPSPRSGDQVLRVVATVDGLEYAEGVDVIRHRDLDAGAVYSPATVTVRGVDLSVAPGLEVGYVMGVGDDVPAAVTQLGARVELLAPADLAAGDLSRFDAIVVGTRAYAVRPDLHAHNGRLLEWVESGGNLVVLYQTQEFVPERQAPHPASLPASAEEVSEEDAPVRLLAPGEPSVVAPNRIGAADFDGWVEQRGSKFFTEWSDAYTPLVETADTGQDPQRGVWLTARHGAGHYSYVALALHRQLPYGVTGAYRILANLLSLGRTAR